MKIKLDYPFNQDFKTGYVNVNKEPRRVCLLVRKDNSQTSMSYARYLMSCSLRRYLLPEEHVDHIDNDKLNDVIGNLQILSQAENNRKSKYKGLFSTFICPICSKEFNLDKRQAYGKNNPTCSRKCGGIKSHITNPFKSRKKQQ